MVFKIRSGLTGFTSQTPFAVAQFARACHELSRDLWGEVVSVAEPRETPSFYQARFQSRSEDLSLVCHSTYPWFAFAEPIDEVPGGVSCALVFMDPPPDCRSLFEDSELRCLTKAELATPMARCDLSALLEEEIKQVEYWKPKTLGELVFNWWD